MNLGWDAQAYDQYATPHDRWGLETLNRLRLAGTETVVDFGCGTGRDVERLLNALPNGRVVAVDGSARMLARLRDRLAHRLDSVEILEADLRDRLPLTSVDAVMSVATLHWLPDHAAVFANIAEVLRPGGRFAAEAGGAGNIASILAAVARVGYLSDRAIKATQSCRNFADVDETVDHLVRAGFVDIEVDLVAEPMSVPEGRLVGFLSTVLLVPELREVPAEQRSTFVRAVAREVGEPVIDWVRIRLTATRS